MDDTQLKALKDLAYVVTICASVVTFLIVAVNKHYKNKRAERGDLPAIKQLQTQQQKIMEDLKDLTEAQDRDKKEITSKIVETKADILSFMEKTFILLSRKN